MRLGYGTLDALRRHTAWQAQQSRVPATVLYTTAWGPWAWDTGPGTIWAEGVPSWVGGATCAHTRAMERAGS